VQDELREGVMDIERAIFATLFVLGIFAACGLLVGWVYISVTYLPRYMSLFMGLLPIAVLAWVMAYKSL
jgi:ABC-type transport system involved in cytochrome bd biosynthesis fused ATPase/permease subunit